MQYEAKVINQILLCSLPWSSWFVTSDSPSSPYITACKLVFTHQHSVSECNLRIMTIERIAFLRSFLLTHFFVEYESCSCWYPAVCRTVFAEDSSLYPHRCCSGTPYSLMVLNVLNCDSAWYYYTMKYWDRVILLLWPLWYLLFESENGCQSKQ